MSESTEPTPEVSDQVVSETVAPDTQPVETSDLFTDAPPSEDSPLSKDFKRMQADYTRKTQDVAQERKALEARAQQAEMWDRLQTDPEFQREALERLGYQLPVDEPAIPEYHDPRVDQLILAEQSRQAEAMGKEIRDHIERLSSEAKFVLSDWQRDSLLRQAFDEDPSPARTEEIFKQFSEDLRAQEAAMQKRWLKSKQASHVSPGGEEGSARIDIRDKDARIKRMKSIMEAG